MLDKSADLELRQDPHHACAFPNEFVMVRDVRLMVVVCRWLAPQTKEDLVERLRIGIESLVDE